MVPAVLPSMPREKCGITWANTFTPLFQCPSPECASTAVHLDKHEADGLVVATRGGVYEHEHIVQGTYQSMEDRFAWPPYLEHTLPEATVKFASLRLVEGGGVVIRGQIDRPVPGSALTWKMQCWLVHGIIPPSMLSIQLSKPARLRVTASVNSTPLR